MFETIRNAFQQRYLSIRWKLVLPLAATILILLLVFSPITNLFITSQIEAESDRRLGEVADSVGALIENSEYLARTSATLLANQPEVALAFSNLDENSPTLLATKEALRLQELSLYPPDYRAGDIAYFYGGPQVARRLQVNEQAQAIRDAVISQALEEQAPASSVVIAPQNSQIIGAAPVFDKQTNRLLGVVLVAFYMDQEYIENISGIIDTDLAIVIENKVVVTNIDREAGYETLINSGWLASSEQPTQNVRYRDGTVYRLLAHPLLVSERTQGNILVVAQPIEQLNAVSRNIQIILFVLLGLFAAITVWFWLAAFLTFTRPLEQLTQATTKLSRGEFGQTVSTDYLFLKDEITLLSENFNKMAVQLNDLYASLEERVVQRTQELLEERNKLSVALENLENALKNLAEARDEAIQANQSKSEFVSVVSHELKVPMTSIKGYSELMLAGAAGELNDNQVNYLKTIRSNVNRMATLVSDLSDISRIESGNLRLEPGKVDVREIVEDVVSLARNQIEQKRQNISLHFEDALPVAWCDRNRLGQIVTNLVSNANKYTPEGGKITIETAVKPEVIRGDLKEFIWIQVQDNGLGMTEEDQASLFSKFFRSADSKVREAPGTGLGLSITKNLVELQGGKIWFESQFRKGTTFHITVPIAPKE
jgi:signal transduction histidine kinase